MRVIVATTLLPFASGGAEYMTDSLCEALQEAGHEVERFDLPFSSDYRTMLEEMVALRLLDLSASGDRLVTIRTPSYLLRHPRKSVWFIHHHRGAFDLWGTLFQDLPSGPLGEGYRAAFRAADDVGLREANGLFANSRETAGRLRAYNGLEADVLYPPLRLRHGLEAGPYGDYVLCPGRLTAHKRQLLCIEAMRHARSGVRLVVAGPPDGTPYADELAQRIAAWGLDGQVKLLPRWQSEEEKRALFAGALAVAYLPFREDSYGYVALEATHARKAVVTCSDSGGLLELVEDEVSGLVVPPEPQRLAASFDALYRDKSRAERLGEAAKRRLAALGIAWEPVLARLLA